MGFYFREGGNCSSQMDVLLPALLVQLGESSGRPFVLRGQRDATGKKMTTNKQAEPGQSLKSDTKNKQEAESEEHQDQDVSQVKLCVTSQTRSVSLKLITACRTFHANP